MPDEIIKQFEKQYGTKKGKKVFYATANKQKRNPETFKPKRQKTIREIIDEMFGNC